MTSLMRQRALQRKLAKVNEAAGKDGNEGGEEAKPAGDAAAEEKPKSPMTAKALARQRLLKKKQADKEAAEKEDAERLAAETKKKEEEAAEALAAERAEEEARKMKLAKMEGGLGIMQHVFEKWQNAIVAGMLEQWLTNFAEELAREELEEEEREAELAAQAALEDEENLDAEMAELEGLVAGGTEGSDGMSEEQLKSELQKVRNSMLQQVTQLKSEKDELEQEVLTQAEQLEEEKGKAKDYLKKFQATNKELAFVQRQLLAAKNELQAMGGGAGLAVKSPAKAKGGDISSAEAQELEVMLTDTNKDLAKAQREVLSLRQQLQAAEKGGGGGGGDPQLQKALDKVRKDFTSTNKELSSAQYDVLTKKEALKQLAELVGELVDTLKEDNALSEDADEICGEIDTKIKAALQEKD